MRLLVILSALQRYALTCIATSGSSTATTTTSTAASATTTTTVAGQTTTTTSTTTTTTTTTAAGCNSCTANQIVFSPAVPGTDQNLNSMMGPLTTDPTTGCVSINAICSGQTGMIAFMQFNGNEGGPLENMGMTQTVTATLNCVNGQWFYMTRAVNEVNCSETAPG